MTLSCFLNNLGGIFLCLQQGLDTLRVLCRHRFRSRSLSNCLFVFVLFSPFFSPIRYFDAFLKNLETPKIGSPRFR